jgi:tripartite-type tricarboxylate transporter receptor subunit TctC
MKPQLKWLSLIGALAFSGLAAAQAYPSKPLRFIVGYAAGGGTDTTARAVAAVMEKSLGQPIIVENRPGAGGLIGAQSVGRADPDGSTVHFGTATSFHPVFVKEGVDASKIMDPVTNLQVGGLIFMVRAEEPYNSLQDLVAWSKANPGKLNYAANTTVGELWMAALKSRIGLEYTNIPYPGDAGIITALLGGQVQSGLLNTAVAIPQAQTGKMRMLFVTRSTRSSLAPTVPTLAELGVPGVVWEFYLGLWVPKGTPRAVVQTLNNAGVSAVKQPDLIALFRKFGADAVGSTPEETMNTFQNEVKFWTEAAKLANYKPQ